MNIYSPIQLAFIKFLQSAISKNKKYGYLNLTNKEIAERFEFCKRKYSKRTIEELLIQVKPEFQIIGNTKRRFILPKDSTSITTPFTHHSHTIKPVLPHDSHSINTLANPESLEPQGIQDPLLIDKNQDQLIINKFKKKEKDKKEKEPRTRETGVNPLEDTLTSFVDFRKKTKKPLTEFGLQLVRKKLDALAQTDEEKIKILEQSIVNGWQGIWPLKQQLQENQKSSGGPMVRGQIPENTANVNAYKPYQAEQLTEEEKQQALIRSQKIREETRRKLGLLTRESPTRIDGFNRVLEAVA